MKNKIIKIQSVTSRNPFVSAFLSFITIGFGQMYNGELFKGIILLLLRMGSISIFIFSIYMTHKSSYILDIVIFFILNILLIIISVIDSGAQAYRYDFQYKKYNNGISYLLFIIINYSITSIIIYIFMNIFTLHTITEKNKNLLFDTGDIIISSKIVDNQKLNGFLIMDKNNRLLRIIGSSGDTVGLNKNILYVNKNPIPFGPFNDFEKDYFQLSHDDFLFYEKYNSFKYPIRLNLDEKVLKSKKTIKIKKTEYAVLADDRIKNPAIILIPRSDIVGRVEGILLSYNRKKILNKPYIF